MCSFFHKGSYLDYNSEHYDKIVLEKLVHSITFFRYRDILAAPDSPTRRVITRALELGYKAWSREKGYGRCWAVETAFSTFKRLYMEHSLAKTMDGITKKLMAKVSLYHAGEHVKHKNRKRKYGRTKPWNHAS